MIDKTAGLPTQIRNLEKRLKDMDASKVKPALIKEITDTIKNLKDMLKEKQEKKEQRKRDKEQKAQEVEKEAISVPNAADVGATAPNSLAPATPGQPEATPTSPTAPMPDDQKVACPLCGGMMFNSQAEYQQHMEFTHASDTMPTTPGQKLDKTVAAVDPVVEKVENDPKIAPGVIVPDSVKKHDEIVDKVEKDPKVAPHLVSEQGPQFKLDDEVRPIRGGDSKGKVMRWDGKPNDMVYVMWESGPLKERDGFGGYYPHDLKSAAEEKPVEAALPEPEPVCQKCIDMQQKHGDLKTNYEALLKDLQEERDIHYTQGNNAWVARLDQKIEDLKKSIAEKFEKEGGAQNAEELTIMDHTPPRANSGPDAGGKDPQDEFQDEWALPAGIELQSKLPPKKQRELDGLVQKAVVGYQINVMDMSKVYQAGEAAYISGQDVTAVVQAFLDSMVASGKAMKTSALEGAVTTATQINVFNKELLATPVLFSKKFGGYDISQDGKKLFKINSKDSQPMTKKQLEFCAQIELTRGFKQAKLVEKIACLDAGSKVYIVAEDKAHRRVKFASMDQGLRGWVPASKVAFLVKKADPMRHGDHVDDVFGSSKTAYLSECPQGSGNMRWIEGSELLPTTQPPATPESLNDVESSNKCKGCHKPIESGLPGSYCKECVAQGNDKKATAPYNPDDKPLSFFKDPAQKERADMFGLIDVEDWALTPEGLEAKRQEMIEGHDIEAHGPKRYLSENQIAQELQQAGFVVTNITPPEDESDAEIQLENGWHVQVGSNYVMLGQEHGDDQFTLYKSTPKTLINDLKRLTKTAALDPLVKEFQSKYPEYNGWTFDYMYPGWYRFYKDGSNDVFFTPDNTNTGEVDIQISTPDGIPVDDKGGVAPYKAPLTADALFAIVKPYLDEEGSNKEGLKQALPPVIMNQRTDVNASLDKSAAAIDEDILEMAMQVWLDIITEENPAVSAKYPDNPDAALAQLKAEIGPIHSEEELARKNPQLYDQYEFGKEYVADQPITDSPSAQRAIIDIPVLDKEQKIDELLEQFSKETDPAKKENIKQHIDRIKRASLFIKAFLNKVARVVKRKDGWHVLSEKGKNLGGPYKSKGEAVKRLRQVEYFKHHGSQRPFSKKADALTDHITEMKGRIEQVQEKLNTPPVKTAVVTDETIEETVTNDPNAIVPPVTPVAQPVIQNVQPTDQENLEDPTQAPTSPLPPGQKWQWNPGVGAYVAMTDPANIGKTV